MYKNLRRFFYRPLIVNDIIDTSQNFPAFTIIWGVRALNERKLKLLFAAGGSKFVNMDILEPVYE